MVSMVMVYRKRVDKRADAGRAAVEGCRVSKISGVRRARGRIAGVHMLRCTLSCSFVAAAV